MCRIDNQPAIHLSMKSFFLDGETLDCLAISSHLLFCLLSSDAQAARFG
jgi:hypothetical protein